MIKIAACINKAIKEKDIKVEDDGTITVSEFAELEICVPIEENHLPLPNSDMRTKRVSTQESHIKSQRRAILVHMFCLVNNCLIIRSMTGNSRHRLILSFVHWHKLF